MGDPCRPLLVGKRRSTIAPAPQRIVITRGAGASGFLTFIRSGDRPDRYRRSRRLATSRDSASCRASSAGRSFQFGRTSTRSPPHLPHFTLGGVSPIREGSDLSAL